MSRLSLLARWLACLLGRERALIGVVLLLSSDVDLVLRRSGKHVIQLPIVFHCRDPVLGEPVDCLLLLWRVAAMQQEALDVARAWGFTVKTELVWEKLTKTGKPHFGMGHYLRGSHEVCLLATRELEAVAAG